MCEHAFRGPGVPWVLPCCHGRFVSKFRYLPSQSDLYG